MDTGQVVLQTDVDYSGENRQELASMIVPTIQASLAEVGWQKKELEIIVVGIGPGSFTGIRSAIVTARTLAQALKLPLIGVSLLHGLAVNQGLPCGVIISAGAGHFFLAAYAPDQRLPVIEPTYLSGEELEDSLARVGRWALDEKAFLTLQFRDKDFHKLKPVDNIAAIEAQIAFNDVSWRMLTETPKDLGRYLVEMYPYKEVEPLYLRGPSVTIKKNHGH